jgi:hypothetical protein
MIKIGSKKSLYLYRYFIKHLVGTFRKPRESNLNHETFSLVTQELYQHLPATIPIRTYNKLHLNQILFEEPNATVNKLEDAH